ncbi:MAG: hypothetical protein QXT73_00715 [Candidatus Methanomethylicaceae archaeon]
MLVLLAVGGGLDGSIDAFVGWFGMVIAQLAATSLAGFTFGGEILAAC